jgi:hypothetical protein
MFTRSYTIEPATVPAWTWEDYERVVRAEWDDLLGRTPPPSEAEIQEFLVQQSLPLAGA